MKNAGQRLWEVQKAQRTGLCVGLDLHYDPSGAWDTTLYRSFAKDRKAQDLRSCFHDLSKAMNRFGIPWNDSTAEFLTGLTFYVLTVVDAAYEEGVMVFKPQAAFYERFKEAGPIVLGIVLKHLRELGVEVFVILDAKRGDIDTTQLPYYLAYLSEEEIMPFVRGYGFDTMTVTTWMGEDVLTPGLPFFQSGKGAIVVTRSSNPSGTTLQDAVAIPSNIKISSKQEPFVYMHAMHDELHDLLGRSATNHEVMLYLTAQFSKNNKLDSADGVSPIFSVMGATTAMDSSFRLIRGNGAVPLIPGFGAQVGAFKNVELLIVREGPHAGRWGVLSSSRENMFAWDEKYGGQGDPRLLADEVGRSIRKFRNDEREAYAAAGVDYPF